jgi:uncharacterized membrane protein YdjX (TVP38/TMEM64 family)
MMKRSTLTKIAVVLILFSLIILFIVLDLDRFVSLSYIRASQEKFQVLATEHPLIVIASYMTAYILITSLSLPGAAVLTLLGGALFGLWIGTLVVSFASTIGATLACFVSRFVLRDWVQQKLGDKIKTVNEGVEREGAFYLFTLRLIPIFPFWAINLLMGLTRMPLRTFYWVSQVGMLAGTFVYVNAGKELSKIDALSDILSPSLILSFVLLGILPITTKKVIHFYKNRIEKVAQG